MNTKRQTIWLVSMLSLMVVLSAYYLFSDGAKPNETKTASGEQEQDGLHIDLTGSDGFVPDLTDFLTDVDGTDMEGKTEEEILEEVSARATSGQNYFAEMYLDRNEQFAKEVEELMLVTSNIDNSVDSEQLKQAAEQLDQIEQTFAKVDELEGKLSEQYANALVMQEGGKWKIIVQSDKLERSEAVSIIDLTLEELGISIDQIAGVQHIH